MDNIFITIFNIFMTIFENIGDFLGMILEFIETASSFVVPLVVKFFSWCMDIIENIIDTLAELFGVSSPFGSWGGGGFGGGGGSGI